MRHSRQEGYHHAEGHPVGQEDQRRTGLDAGLEWKIELLAIVYFILDVGCVFNLNFSCFAFCLICHLVT